MGPLKKWFRAWFIALPKFLFLFVKMHSPPFPWSVLWWVALLFPPWNIFWWIVGYVIYKLMGGQKDHSGDYIRMLVFAPAVLPLFLASLLYMWTGEISYKRKQKYYLKVAYWISRELDKKNIRVCKTTTSYNGCVVEVGEMSSTQTADYQEIYARAIVKFSRLSPKEICYDTKPLRYLNQKWAEINGFREYAAEDWSAPCVKCGEKKSLGVQWGNKKSHEKPRWTDNVNRFSFKDGTKEEILGCICRECLWKTPFVSADWGGTKVSRG